MSDIHAKINNLSLSAQKVRLVIDMVRGKSANEALEILRFVNKRAALPVQKLVASAVANAEENFGVSRDDLFVAKINPGVVVGLLKEIHIVSNCTRILPFALCCLANSRKVAGLPAKRFGSFASKCPML